MTHPSQNRPRFVPSPLDILIGCAEIRATHSERERNKRAAWANNPRVEVTTAPGFLDAIQESEAA